MRRPVERLRRVRGEEHAETAAAQLVLGKALRELGRYPDAEAQLLQAERTLQQAAPPAPIRECGEALALLYAKGRPPSLARATRPRQRDGEVRRPRTPGEGAFDVESGPATGSC